jgi:hypothetical protein
MKSACALKAILVALLWAGLATTMAGEERRM